MALHLDIARERLHKLHVSKQQQFQPKLDNAPTKVGFGERRCTNPHPCRNRQTVKMQCRQKDNARKGEEHGAKRVEQYGGEITKFT